MSKTVLILGINGFIGSHLAAAILKQTDWRIVGLDLDDDKLDGIQNDPRVEFKKADLLSNFDWVEEQVQHCDMVLPLVAIANPLLYVQQPLRVFELDFEANLRIIKMCVKHQTRVVFPSTSEVYGMSPDVPFDENTSPLVLGPINKERWIYSCSKQLLDRVIYAYGRHEGLQYTLFRPFNWIGPKLDYVFGEKAKSSRVLAKFIHNITEGKSIELVDGGEQRRCFTDIDDAIDALLRILRNENNVADQRIFNIGNPHNDHSIRDLAEQTLSLAHQYEKFATQVKNVQIIHVSSDNFYGKGYQDVSARVPSINAANEYLGWEPKYDLQHSIKSTLDYYLG